MHFSLPEIGVVKLLLIFFLFFGCAETQLKEYKSWQLSKDVRVSKEYGKSWRNGHLLVPGNGSVLEIHKIYSGNIFAVDDETCESVRIEIPKIDPAVLPFKIDSPRAFYDSCSCTWFICGTEEALMDGKITIQEVTSKGVKADLTLKFKSKTFRKSEYFIESNPNFTLIGNSKLIK